VWRQCVVELLKFVKMRRVDYILRERERERERELTEKDERVQQWLSSTRTAIKKTTSHHNMESENESAVTWRQQYLNLALMYRMYKEDHSQKTVSESIYRKMFKTEFNLKFQLSKKDTCTKCDAYQTQLNGLQSKPQKGAET